MGAPRGQRKTNLLAFPVLLKTRTEKEEASEAGCQGRVFLGVWRGKNQYSLYLEVSSEFTAVLLAFSPFLKIWKQII